MVFIEPIKIRIIQKNARSNGDALSKRLTVADKKLCELHEVNAGEWQNIPNQYLINYKIIKAMELLSVSNQKSKKLPHKQASELLLISVNFSRNTWAFLRPILENQIHKNSKYISIVK